MNQRSPGSKDSSGRKSNELPQTFHGLTSERMQSIGVRLGRVEYKNVETDIRASGSVDVDQRRLSYIQTRYPGWIKDVFVSATYEFVKKGQPLFTIYSPELVASEQEYLLAKANLQRVSQSSVQGVSSGADTLLRAARDRLAQWNLSDADISNSKPAVNRLQISRSNRPFPVTSSSAWHCRTHTYSQICGCT